MSSRLGQELKQEQTFSLSPVQLLTSKLVELTGLELEQRIERELEDNPALEEGRKDSDEAGDEPNSEQDWELGEYASEDDIPAYKLKELQERQSFREEIPFASSAPSLDTLLLEQLSIEGLTEQEEAVARYIIGNINSDGYLTRGIEDLQDDLLFKEGIDIHPKELQQLIERIKALEPAGIAASDLRECLLLQLERQEPSTHTQLAVKLLNLYYSDFINKRFERLTQELAIDKEELAELYTLIAHLNPKPGVGYGVDYEDKLQHFNPDFVVWEDEEGDLQLQLVGERDIRPLTINATYQDYLTQGDSKTLSRQEKDTQDFIKHKLEQARWFIEALTQRQETLKKTMQAIVAWQRTFFLTGDIAELKPMILKNIAERTGLDISTISRVSNSKSVQTNFGIFPIKYFFSEGYTSDTGESVSSKAIKQKLQELIEQEDKQAPWTDDVLVERLSDLGYNLARRTVAKYRKELKIPTAQLRRQIVS